MVSNDNFIRQAMNKRNSFERYNQGFLKFGPMEQAEEGKWVEAEPTLNLLDQCLNELTLNDMDFDSLYEDKLSLEIRVDSLKLMNFVLAISLALTFTLLVAFRLALA